MPGIYSRLAELIRANKPAVMATALSGPVMGQKMLIAEGTREGSIHASIDEALAQDAAGLLAEGTNKTVRYMLEKQPIDVFIESFPTPQRLIIVGAVHIAIPLHRLARMLGYYVTVVDARGILATEERFPEADSLLVEWPDEALDSLGLDSSTSVVVLTHDPKFDHPALASALRSEARYIGAIGSRTTNNARMAALREMGFTEEALSRIHAPIGLDIGATTPAEIALAILGEIVADRYGRGGGPLSKRERGPEALLNAGS